ncbi:hypothetical protein SAMN05421827_102203 [Pedobacter terrae]|uniref:HNH endonuclease 5 domain-containing protein n=1 Tax=Pedobacter terrae TaxID=405671 RepID=A0A1G7Q8X4_9SPHI|nr:HNH endonuclease [Pedobacter terrae]SDF94399.1 hypothetical protein SAMN05421827_102203 [Pedobacter terrae]
MNTCYLCNEPMIDRKAYELNPESFHEKPKFIHGEHVIQDSLYGRLKSDKILCESCGSQLSVEVDSDFGKIFQSISEQFAHILTSTEKNKNFQPSLKGHVVLMDGRKIPVFIKGGIINPQKPFFDLPVNGEVKVYGESKTAKNFINFAKSELKKQGYEVEKLKFTIVSNLQDHIELGIHFSEGVEDFDRKLKMGFIKIATGFAMMNGVDRNDTPNTIDVKENALIYTDQIVPYIPCEVFEMVYDQQRIALEPEFPNHTLILYVDDYGDQKKLICYVDLFSTFAFYVVLNDNYKGKDVHSVYQQSITKMEKPEINIMNQSPKKLLIVEQFLKIGSEETKGMTLDERFSFVQKRYNQFTVSYEMDLTDSIEAVASKIAMHVAAKKMGKLDLLNMVEREMMESLPDLKVEDLMLIREEYLRMKREDPEKIYRQSHIGFHGKELYLKSNYYNILERQNSDMESIRRYTHMKFNLLNYFIQNHKDSLND